MNRIVIPQTPVFSDSHNKKSRLPEDLITWNRLRKSQFKNQPSIIHKLLTIKSYISARLPLNNITLPSQNLHNSAVDSRHTRQTRTRLINL